ncbi:hypothetical protein MNBD_UNCLBAC01-1924 [hydrothermal vent metagenome]|uniref:Antitoxin n=1 Tax=hydrothermal vent metagenome TaxID=652676 RepID=A0A3B1DUQ5_9ZZZZ
MVKINVKEARSQFSSLLDIVQEGDEVIILRRGKPVARLVSLESKAKVLPSLKDFRTSIRSKGKGLSQGVIQGREEERY